MGNTSDLYLGDIAISVERAESQATENELDFRTRGGATDPAWTAAPLRLRP